MHVFQMFVAPLCCEGHQVRCYWDYKCEWDTCFILRSLLINEKDIYIYIYNCDDIGDYNNTQKNRKR